MATIPDTPNYQESTVSGKTWRRSHHVVILNPVNIEGVVVGVSQMAFGEENVTLINDSKVLKEFIGQDLIVTFDPEDPDDQQLYVLMNKKYVKAREKRDALVAAGKI